MNIDLECLYCIVKKFDKRYSNYENDKQKKVEFMKKVFSIIGNSKDTDTTPYVSSKINKILKEEFNIGDIYFDIKKKYNKLLLSMEDNILEKIHKSDDKLLMAIKYAMAGNFIDFGAMDDVPVDKLKELIENAPNESIDETQYKNFLKDLNNAKSIAYVTDNSGEIVFDKVLISVIKKLYPHININVIVRGKPAANDATITDAKEVGLCDMVNVVGNGMDVTGTQLDKISPESRKLIDYSDIVISKGQGNFETLLGCNKNIYYMFLCKCNFFVNRFSVERFKGIFINERCVK